ncbi:trypco2 family protein [Dietzia sp. PP-33]|uniref:trypco2 family protein n=1 Tax=Dietzia sp. PP-33 TaxID=2957500 RepID=UPI0029B2A4D5|nr:trypco2 family protein [Dietzia sp. PP-33]MDX2358788.1 hypothetical protein [Dietzia sp. PP-33]
MDNTIGLNAAINGLRQELQEVLEAGDGKKLRFSLSPVELTLTVVVSVEGEAGIRWSLLRAGGSVARESTQTLTLTLKPYFTDSDGSEQSGDDFRISEETPVRPNIGSTPPL